MTTFQVSVPESKISSFREFMEAIGAEYSEFTSGFELTEEQKKLLDKIDDIPPSEYTPANVFLQQIRREYEL